MRNHVLLVILVLVIAASGLALIPSGPSYPTAHAAGVPTLQVVSPTLGGNITDLTLTPGSKFTVNVAVKDVGMLTGFDIAVKYVMSQRVPTPIIEDSFSLSTGIFNGNGLTGNCQPFTIRTDVLGDPIYIVRIAEVILGGCQVDGTNGVLFTITFDVTATGATSIDVQQASDGSKSELLVGGPTNGPIPGLQVSGAYFRNKPGIPPVAKFTYTPFAPAIGNIVNFNGTQSYDPDNPSGPSKGIKTFIWDFSDASPNTVGTVDNASITPHIFLFTPTDLGSGYYSARLVVIDSNDGLPAVQTLVVFIDPGKTHNIAISISADKTTAHVGETVAVTVTIVDRGNQNENVNLAVSYDFQGTTKLHPDNAVSDDNFSVKVSSPPVNLKYTVPSANLSPRVYTITAIATLLGNATDSNPADNTDKVSFTLLSAPTTNNAFTLSVPALAVGAIAVLAAIIGGAQLLKRQRKAKADSADALA